MAIRITHNAPQVVKRSKALHKAVVFASRKVAVQGGRHIRDTIKEEIPPPKGSGKFPGYKAKGTLKKAPVVLGPYQRPRKGDWQVQVAMRPNASQVYQRIHEVGGVIRPQRAQWLVFPKPPDWAPRSAPIPGNKAFVFQRGGQWYVAAKAVRIKRKRYFATGWRRGVKSLPRKMHRALVREMK